MQQKPIILDYNDHTINVCVERILNNQLVAFPTETVYGLGANGLCEEACNKIYEYNSRIPAIPTLSCRKDHRWLRGLAHSPQVLHP